MLSSRCHCPIVFAVLTGLAMGPLWLNAQNEITTPAKSASAKKELTPSNTRARSVDLEKTVTFSLTLGANSTTNILFNGINKKGIQFADPASDKVNEIIKAEFGKDTPLDGVVINVAKNVKYPMVNSLFKNIRSAMDENDISKPIYIAVQDPLADKKIDDQPTTQEFVIKHKKAADLYDRVSNVSKLFKVSVRLDPARNSITAKGPANKIKAIQNLISALDRPAGATTDPNKKIKPIIVEEKNDPVDKSANNKSPNSNSGANTAPPQLDRPKTDNSKAGNSFTPKNGLQPVDPKSSSSNGPVGKYQMTAVGNNLFLLDTTTGETWILDPSQERLSWIRLPHPNPNQ